MEEISLPTWVVEVLAVTWVGDLDQVEDTVVEEETSGQEAMETMEELETLALQMLLALETSVVSLSFYIIDLKLSTGGG